MLRKYEPDPSHVIMHELLLLWEDLTYAEDAIQIMDHQEHKLQIKTL